MDAIALIREISIQEGSDSHVLSALEEALKLTGTEQNSLDALLSQACKDAPAGVREPCQYIIEAGGKRIRPAICLLCYRAAGGTEQLPVDLAISCELIHNATLLHDDVIDEGEMRRGRPAARMKYGNAISVLGGDYLLVRAVEMISARGSKFIDSFVKTMHCIVEGELIQLKRRRSIETTLDEYYRIIQGKTASLFRWAARSGAMAAGANEDACDKIGMFGWHLGVAFQIVDDILDLTADASRLGKVLLADINEGKMTIPLILACQESPENRAVLAKLLDRDGAPDVAGMVAGMVETSGSLDMAKESASRHTMLAIQSLDELRGMAGEEIDMLKNLATALLNRGF